jgi:hypothetical protein
MILVQPRHAAHFLILVVLFYAKGFIEVILSEI